MKNIALIIILINLLNGGIFEEDLQKCKEGNAESCSDVGDLYFRGYHKLGMNIEQDSNKSFYFTKKGCDGGYMYACFNLATMYWEKGDNYKALQLYKKACDAKVGFKGCRNAATIYYNGGVGIEKNFDKMLEFAEKGCNLGDKKMCHLIKEYSVNKKITKQEQTQTEELKWMITPSTNQCINGGGEIKKEACEAGFVEAQKICKSIGGELPTIEKIESIMTSCGFTLVNVSDHSGDTVASAFVKNLLNISNTSCYTSKGILLDSYWTSSKPMYAIDFSKGILSPALRGFVSCVSTKSNSKNDNKKGNEFIIIGAGVKLREKSTTKSKAVYISTFGMIGTSIDKIVDKENETFYQIIIGDKKGWINQKYLYPLDKKKRDEIFLKISTDKFKSSKSNFGNLVEIGNFLESAIDNDLTTKEKLISLHKQVLKEIIKIIEKDTTNNTHYKKWLEEKKGILKHYDLSKNYSSPNKIKNKFESNICTDISYDSKETLLRNKLLSYLERGEKYGTNPLSETSMNFLEATGLATQYYYKQDFCKAFCLLELPAKYGMSGAENDLGIYYQEGWCIPSSIDNARYWYKKAVESDNHPYAMFNLGELSEKEGDIYKAIYWYKKFINSDSDKLFLFQKQIVIAKKRLDDLNLIFLKESIKYAQIGNSDLSQGKYKSALKNFQKALEIQQQIGENNSFIAQSYINIGTTFGYLNEYIKSLEYSQKGIDILLKKGETKNITVARAYNDMSETYREKEDYTNALKYSKKALDIVLYIPETDSHIISVIYNNMGLIYYSMEKYGKALDYHEKALDLRETLDKNSLDTANSYHNLGLLYGSMGDYQKALDYYKKAISIRENKLGDKHPKTIISYHGIAYVYQKMKNYSEALKYFKKTLTLSKEVLGENHYSLGAIYNNMATLYASLKDYPKSLKYSLKALAILEKKSNKDFPITIATIYSNMSVIYGYRKNLSQAIKYSTKALNIRKKIFDKGHLSIANSYYNIGQLYMLIGDYHKGYRYIKNSFDILKKNRNQNFTILDKNQKQLYLKSNKIQNYSLIEISQLYKNTLKNKTQKTTLKKDTLNSWLNYKRAIYDTQNSLNLLYAKGDKKINAKIDQLHTHQRRLARLYQNVPKEAKKINQYNQNIKNTKEEISKLEIWLSSKSSNLYTKDIDYGDIVEILKEDELYIDFAKVGGRYYYFTVDKDEQIVFEMFDENKTKLIDKSIKAIQMKIDDGYPSLVKNEFTELYDLIIRDMKLGDKKSLIVSTDGILGLVPFEAFYDAKEKQYLIEQFSVRYIPSGKELVKLANNHHQSKKDIVVFADIDFPKEKGSKIKGGIFESLQKIDIGYLKYSKLEALNIKKYFKEAKLLLEKNATEGNLIGLNQPKILHLSTHGVFLNDKNITNPLEKSLILLHGADKSIKEKKSDGIISGLELAGLNLKGTELVVLSACQTGLGDIEEAEGVAGINKAFMLAGAKHIVMSLWSVNDKATAKLMSMFYENIKKKMNYSDALREAKRSMIKIGRENKSTNYWHPLYWSGFVGSGI